MRATLVPLLLWAACTEEGPPTPGGTTGLPATSGGPCRSPGPDQPYDGPTRVHDVVVVCHGQTLTIDVCAIGWTSTVLARLGTPEVEEHELGSVRFDEHHHWDQALVALDATGTYARSASTAWSCEDGSPAVAVLVHDLDGQAADCVVTGDAVEGTEDWGCRPLERER